MKSSLPLVLGTAQLGMPYGIANRTGKPDSNTAKAIIQTAWENGIVEFDTAQAYGESEEVIGKALTQIGINNQVRVISKLDPKLNHLEEQALKVSLEQSLDHLKIDNLYALFLHREDLLDFWEDGLKEILAKFVKNGYMKHIGISVYTTEKALQALNSDFIDMVQVPASILDHRFSNAGVFEAAVNSSKTIYVRSVFLQGLILMSPENLPLNMKHALPLINAIEILSNHYQLSKQRIALNYLRVKCRDAKIVFGAESVEQVKENIDCWYKDIPQNLTDEIDHTFNTVKEEILNPSLWNR
jgi:aryl-alcohol dehydrogenase-like predicted oxidoreductase